MTLQHPEEQSRVSGLHLVSKCGLFRDTPLLLHSPYHVKASVSLNDFRQFIDAINGHEFTITSANFAGLSLLAEEFHFETLQAQLSEFHSSPADVEARARIATLEQQAVQRDRQIAELRAEFSRMDAEIERLSTALESRHPDFSSLRRSSLAIAVAAPSIP
jgi:hypothetical protein